MNRRPAKLGDPFDTLRHSKCNGAIEYDRTHLRWRCVGCGVGWSYEAQSKWTSQDVADRFYVPVRNETPDALVYEVDDGGHLFYRTSGVYLDESPKCRRVSLKELVGGPP